jgi:hypothetical protein
MKLNRIIILTISTIMIFFASAVNQSKLSASSLENSNLEVLAEGVIGPYCTYGCQDTGELTFCYYCVTVSCPWMRVGKINIGDSTVCWDHRYD